MCASQRFIAFLPVSSNSSGTSVAIAAAAGLPPAAALLPSRRSGVRRRRDRWAISPMPSARARGMLREMAPPVLLCYDGSVEAERAIDLAAELLGPRRAVVLDVWPLLTPDESVAVVSAGMPAELFAETNEADALGRAELGAEHARRAGFAAEPRATAAGPIGEEILRIADEIDAAVIVLGSRGLHGLEQLLAGSVSRDVVRHSHRPVLVVPPADAPPGGPTGRPARRTAPRRPTRS
jgi:nucleotide-binding universal stress UspA family protein